MPRRQGTYGVLSFSRTIFFYSQILLFSRRAALSYHKIPPRIHLPGPIIPPNSLDPSPTGICVQRTSALCRLSSRQRLRCEVSSNIYTGPQYLDQGFQDRPSQSSTATTISVRDSATSLFETSYTLLDPSCQHLGVPLVPSPGDPEPHTPDTVPARLISTLNPTLTLRQLATVRRQDKAQATNSSFRQP